MVTATVSPSSATGTVALLDGGKTYLTTSLSRGQATFSTNALSVGSHSITMTYSGDGNYAGSTSSVLTETINAIALEVAAKNWLKRNTR
jgi:hypothetical protein